MIVRNKITNIWITVCMLMCLFLTVAASANDVDKNRARVEELFLWKVSDALALDSKQEIEFSKIMKKLREDKARLDGQMEDVLRKIDAQKDEKAQISLLEEYKGYLREYSSYQSREIEQLDKLLGPQKVAKYLVLKEKLINRLKGALVDAGKVADSKVKAKKPKIVHEE